MRRLVYLFFLSVIFSDSAISAEKCRRHLEKLGSSRIILGAKFLAGILPPKTLYPEREIDATDELIWNRTVQGRREVGIWEALDSSGKVMATQTIDGDRSSILPQQLSDSFDRLASQI